MKGLAPLFLGLFGTFMFSWVGLTVIPNMQIGRLDPQSLEEDTDIYPMPQSGMAQRGLQVYSANGCAYCHSRWVRADYAGADQERKWGDRRSAPRDYLFERPVMLGKMRTGPDLANIGQRAPAEDEGASPSPLPPAGGASPAAQSSPASSPAVATAQKAGSSATPPPGGSPAAAGSPAPTAQASPPAGSLGDPNKPKDEYSVAWHHRHLYSPRSVVLESIMPAYRFLYEKRPITGQPSLDALKLTGRDAPPDGWEVIPTYDAQCLVAFLMSSNQSHPLNETRSAFGAAAAPAASPATSPAASSSAPAK
jgi:cbb3-type cytochrome oxidase cytochrome c subunit